MPAVQCLFGRQLPSKCCANSFGRRVWKKSPSESRPFLACTRRPFAAGRRDAERAQRLGRQQRLGGHGRARQEAQLRPRSASFGRAPFFWGGSRPQLTKVFFQKSRRGLTPTAVEEMIGLGFSCERRVFSGGTVTAKAI